MAYGYGNSGALCTKSRSCSMMDTHHQRLLTCDSQHWLRLRCSSRLHIGSYPLRCHGHQQPSLHHEQPETAAHCYLGLVNPNLDFRAICHWHHLMGDIEIHGNVLRQRWRGVFPCRSEFVHRQAPQHFEIVVAFFLQGHECRVHLRKMAVLRAACAWSHVG